MMLRKYWRNSLPKILLILIVIVLIAPSISQAQSLKRHPIILVHGINGLASTYWNEDGGKQSIYQELQANGYDMDLVIRFAYPPDAAGKEDPVADVTASAEKLRQEIENLRAQSGSDKVDIVAHSLGGLITREYMRRYPDNHHIDKFIDIATPHSGSGIVGKYNSAISDIASFGGAAQPGSVWDVYIKPAILDGLNDFAYDFWKKNLSSYVPDPNAIASQQLDPNGRFIKELNAGTSPQDSAYHLLYGDIGVNIKIDFFGNKAEFNDLVKVGDLVMTTQNASTIPAIVNSSRFSSYVYKTYGFEGDLDAELKFYWDTWKPDMDFSVVDPTKLDAWHNGLVRNPEVNQKILAILKDGYLAPSTPIPITSMPGTTVPIRYGTASSTVMLFDVSGSMDGQDATGVTKIDAAKHAGGRILDILEAENAAGQGAEIAILGFSSTAQVAFALSPDVAAARSALDGVRAYGSTGMADGLRLAIDQFPSSQQGGKPIILLLSDGIPNIGLGGNSMLSESEIRQEVLGLASEAGGKGICIYTVGFGVPGTTGGGWWSGASDIDEDLLKQIASNSACGEYYNAQNATDLANVYVGLRHQSLGQVLFQKSGEIAQDETLEVGTAMVPQGHAEMMFTLNWPGSRLDPALFDPSGQKVTPNYPGATFYNSASLASIIIQNPAPGPWRISATGVDVPSGRTVYNSVVSVRGASSITPAPPAGGGLPFVVAFITIGVLGLAVYMVITTSRRGRVVPAAASAQLISLSGQPGAFLRDNFLIGRARQSDLFLPHRAVSRQHARIRFADGRWFIQDLGSDGGVYVNGQKVSAARLNPGDRIRIGANEFEFRE